MGSCFDQSKEVSITVLDFRTCRETGFWETDSHMTITGVLIGTIAAGQDLMLTSATQFDIVVAGAALMVQQEVHETRTPESIDPTGIWRLLFWLTFLLGTLSFLVSWLMASFMPPPPDHDFTLVYIVRSCIAVPMLISMLMARWIWKIRNPLTNEGPATAMRIVLFIAWVQLAIVLLLSLGLQLELFLSRH
jgi:hypothetical protein